MVVVVVAVAVTVACGVALLALRDGDQPDDVVVARSAAEVADHLGCAGVEVLDHTNAPIRGGAATGGIACEVDGVSVHVFEAETSLGGVVRAVLPAWPSASYAPPGRPRCSTL